MNIIKATEHHGPNKIIVTDLGTFVFVLAQDLVCLDRGPTILYLMITGIQTLVRSHLYF